MAIPVLDADDIKLLKEMATAFKGGRSNSPSRTSDVTDDPQAPDVYIAYPQETTGIPALQDAVGTGTGTAPEEGDIPGSGLCDIYRISGTEILDVGLSQTVYNLSDSDVPQGWLTVIRDKFGDWLLVSGGGGLAPYIITELNPDVGTGTGTMGTGTGADDLLAAIYRTSHQFVVPSSSPSVSRYGFAAKPARRAGLTWEAIPASTEVYIISDGLGGVCFTGQHCFASRINGGLTWVSGPSGDFFADCQARENIGPGVLGTVSLIPNVFAPSTDSGVVLAINLTLFTVYDRETCGVIFDDRRQQFYIIQKSCPG